MPADLMVRRHYFYHQNKENFYRENTKKNNGSFTAICNDFGGQLHRLHCETNTARKYDFGGAL